MLDGVFFKTNEMNSPISVKKNTMEKKWKFEYVKTEYNPYYNLQLTPLVYITNKSDKALKRQQYIIDEHGNKHLLYIADADNPPYQKLFKAVGINNEEYTFSVNNYYVSYKNLNKKLDEFKKVYAELHQQKKITCLRIDLTMPEHNNRMTISKFTDYLKKNITRKGINFYGYLWKYEIGMKNYLFHYHLLLIIGVYENNERTKQLFDNKKLEDIWGHRVYVKYIDDEFDNNINYLRKNNKKFITSKTKRCVYKLFGSSKFLIPDNDNKPVVIKNNNLITGLLKYLWCTSKVFFNKLNKLF
jgi:hypothetical protein